MKLKKKKTMKLNLSKEAVALLSDISKKHASKLMVGESPRDAADRGIFVAECRAANDAQLFIQAVKTLLDAGGSIQGVN